MADQLLTLAFKRAANSVTALFSENVRHCPKCQRLLSYRYALTLAKAVTLNSACRSCCEKGNWTGLHHTKATKDKIRVTAIGNRRSVGCKRTPDQLKKMRGRKWSTEAKHCVTGKAKTTVHRMHLSIAASRRASRHYAEHGSWPMVDNGSIEYFNNLNLHNGFHIQHPNVYFAKLGRWADGYDPVIHAWFEYDTPYHLKAVEKDSRRQSAIIAHFNEIGRPLAAFYRVNRTGVGEPGLCSESLSL